MKGKNKNKLVQTIWKKVEKLNIFQKMWNIQLKKDDKGCQFKESGKGRRKEQK